MAKKKSKMKSKSLAQLERKYYGKKGSKSRSAYDKEVKQAIYDEVIKQIEIPMTPNFIRLSGAGPLFSTISIQNLTDGQLRIIGEKWTKELINKARKKRKANYEKSLKKRFH